MISDGTAKLIGYKWKDGRTIYIPTDEVVDYRTFSQQVFHENFGPDLFGRHSDDFRKRIGIWESFERDNQKLVALLEYTEENITKVAIEELARVKDDFRSGRDVDTDPVLIELGERKEAMVELHMPALYTAYRYLQHRERDNSLLTA